VEAAAWETRVSREAVEVVTGREPQAAIIWLHGLGADGHDFEPLVPQLVQPADPALRFVFPNAPMRAVTLNGGYAMRAWYDIVALDRRTAEDAAGIRASQTIIADLIRRENQRGMRTARIVLAGFSQGGAMALYAGTRYPEKLAGIMGLSCYQVLAESFATERSAANQSTPVFLAHGSQDPVVAPALGLAACRQLQALSYAVEWHEYSMPHSVNPQEVADIAAWLRRVLA
jgi:phospholipase/carboxylesterase